MFLLFLVILLSSSSSSVVGKGLDSSGTSSSFVRPSGSDRTSFRCDTHTEAGEPWNKDENIILLLISLCVFVKFCHGVPCDRMTLGGGVRNGIMAFHNITRMSDRRCEESNRIVK